MSRTRTAEDLVTDVLQRTGLENSEFVSPAEVMEFVNQELAELRSHIRRAEGHPHKRSSFTIPVVAGTSLYAITAADFWELMSIEISIGGLNRQLEPFMENERARLINTQIYPYSSSPMYRVMGDSIEFLPSTQTFTATVFYAPNAPRLRLGIVPPDTVDGYNGYEIAAIYGACATVREKEETDPSFFLGQKDRIYKLIEANAANRDAGHPERVTDATGALDQGLYGSYGWW